MPALLTVPITAPVTAAVGPVLELRTPLPNNVAMQGRFAYGSGGTTVTAWVQTSLDGGGTWTDVACFQFLLASARLLFNLSALTAVTTQYTPTDGALAVNTAKDGLIGSMWRVKYTTTGTYAGNTTLEIDLSQALTT
jgi:hypothetical protein